MRVFEISSVYPAYIKSFYRRYPNAKNLSYAEQKALILSDGNGGAAPYEDILKKYGIQMESFYQNITLIQNTWAKENGYKGLSDDEIALKQVELFKPDILWYTHYDNRLLEIILSKVPSIRKVIGWVGSAIPRTEVWRNMDVILTCAPETADYFNGNGMRGMHIHHAFDKRVLEKMKDDNTQFSVIFIGQIIKAKGFHNVREQILEDLVQSLELTIFSPSEGENSYKKKIVSSVEKLANRSVKTLGSIHLIKKLINSNAELTRIFEKDVVNGSLSRELRSAISPAVFGIEMYQTIHQSKLVLNIHADSSPKFASNMRLWESTGVRSCLVTDWKMNISELFVPDKEVVVYKNKEECVEKIKWLINHQEATKEIARAGQLKCLKEHTYENRAEILAPLLNQVLS